MARPLPSTIKCVIVSNRTVQSILRYPVPNWKTTTYADFHEWVNKQEAVQKAGNALLRGCPTVRKDNQADGEIIKEETWTLCMLPDGDCSASRQMKTTDLLLNAFHCSYWLIELRRLYFNIDIRTMTGRTIKFKVDEQTTVSNLKRQLHMMERIPLDQQRFIFAGKQLEDHATLGHYQIEPGSQVHLVLRLRGGGGGDKRFFSAMREDQKSVIQFSRHAPLWRRATPGLCLEYQCPWSDCEAHQHSSPVIIPLGIHEGEGQPFDLFTDMKVQCPSCKREQILNGNYAKLDLTAGFANCDWRMEGVMAKAEKEDELEIRSTSWQTVENEYHLFDGKHGTDAQGKWLRLKIYTRHNDGMNDALPGLLCALCMECIGPQESFQRLHCQHRLHTTCWQFWAETYCLPSRIKCPSCRQSAIGLDLSFGFCMCQVCR